MLPPASAALSLSTALDPNSDTQSSSPGASEHSHQSASPEHEHPQARGKKRARPKRQGKVVNVLRQQLGLWHWQPRTANIALGPSSPSALLRTATLQAALNYHLVHSALETLEFISSENWHSLGRVLADLRLLGSKSDDGFLNCAVAAAAALGARSSHHTAIIGYDKPEPAHSSADDRLDLSLGRRREAACVALANRAMAMADEGGYLTENSVRGRALSEFMRAIFTCMLPPHAHARTLTRSIKFQIDSSEHNSRRDTKMSLYYDACASYSLRDGPLSSQAELGRVGFEAEADELLRTVRHGEGSTTLDGLWSDIVIVVMRQLCMLQLSKPIPTTELDGTFTRLFRLGDVLLSLLPTAVVVCRFDAPATRVLAVMKSTTAFEVAVFSQSKRHLRGRNLSLWTHAQTRFVEYVALLGRTIARADETTPARHLAADKLMALEAVPEWPRMVAEAAAQHAAGEGPLAAARLTVFDLAPLHRALRQGAAIFGPLADREENFVEALEAHGLSEECSGGSGAAWIDMGGKCWLRAEFMIERAIDELMSD